MGKGIAFITGASSGIGSALASELAARGYDLGLFARRTDKLDELAASIRARSDVRVFVDPLDVAKTETIAPAVDRMRDRLGGLDLMIANAGITCINRTGGGNIGMDQEVLQVNLIGAMATIDAAARHFRKEKRGHLVGVSSVSAYQPIAGSGAYSASKAGFTSYLGAAREELRKHGIRVTTIHPGWVKTDITPGMEKLPFIVSAEDAAKEIVDGFENHTENIVVPAWPWKLIVPAMQVLPRSLTKRFF